jgi:hypothetical protein
VKHFWRFLPPALTLFIAQIQPAAANTGSLWFEEVSEEARILNGGASWGSSWGDFNGDGWPDLWTSSHHRAPSLYLNMKDGTFEDIASQVLSVDIWEQIELRDAHGAAWADFDNDGDQDLIEFADGGSSKQQPNYILVNNGGAYFEEQSEELGISVLQARGRTPLWLDWDKDGRLDILITSLSTPFVSLYQQNDFGFEDITNSIGLNIDKLTQFAFLSDFTGDGALDLALSPTDLSIRVFSKENNTLVEQTTSLGLDQYFSSIDSISSDLNGDLVPDAYVVRGEVTSDVVLVSDTKIEAHLTARKNEVGFVFLTNGTISVDLYPTFAVDPSKVYIGSSGLNPSSSSFTLSSQDPGTEGIATHEPGVSDGIYIGFDTINQSWSLISSTSGRVASNFVIESDKPISGISALGFDTSLPAPDDSLLIKTGGVYLDNTLLAGINAPSSGRNIAVGDFDNDMDLDIYIVSTGPVENLPNILYENNGAGIFAPVQGAGGAAGTLLGRGDAVSVADYNQDGFLDLFVTNGISKAPFHFDGPYQLFRNIGNGNHWIEIDLEGVTSNRDGIGARVLLTAGGVTQLREQGGGMHLRAQNHQRLHFGLGTATAIDKIEIEWPSGIVQTINNLPADEIVHVIELSSSSVFGRPTYAPGVDGGVYIWKETFDGPYRLRVNGNGALSKFNVQLIADQALQGVAPYQLNTYDTIDWVGNHFFLASRVTAGEDGIDINLPSSANALIAIEQDGAPNPRQLHIGASGMPLSPAGWIVDIDNVPPLPLFQGGNDLGLFVGKNSTTDPVVARWNGDGQFHRADLAMLFSEPVVSVTQVGFETSDVVESTAFSVLSSGVVSSGWDGLDIAVQQGSKLGLAYVQDDLGQPNRVNPDTRDFGLANAYWLPRAEPYGEPQYNPVNDAGLFLWKDQVADVWYLRVTAGGGRVRYTGELVSDIPFTSVNPFKVEAGDVLDATNATRIMFDLRVQGQWEDGIDFQIPAGATVRLDLQEATGSSAEAIRIGAQVWPVGRLPLDISGW